MHSDWVKIIKHVIGGVSAKLGPLNFTPPMDQLVLYCEKGPDTFWVHFNTKTNGPMMYNGIREVRIDMYVDPHKGIVQFAEVVDTELGREHLYKQEFQIHDVNFFNDVSKWFDRYVVDSVSQ